jgi:DNA-binding winged helix-turn-helix (wHTH) protein/Flp pilus assembly protein TadD
MSVYKFRNCILHSTERYVKRDDEYLPLTPKAFDVLRMLVEGAGEVITRDELLGKVWNGAIVEEGNLTVHISKSRSALGGSNGERFIETVSGSGYRFIPSVDLIENGTSTNGHHTGPYDHDSEAIRYYLKGKHFRDKRTIPDTYTAIDYLQKALAQDPSNVNAYIELILSHSLLSAFDQVSHLDTMSTIRPLLTITSAFDQKNDNLQVVYGEVKLFLEWDIEGAEKCFRDAIELNPDCSQAIYCLSELLIYSGRAPEAIVNISRLRQIDPFSLRTMMRVGRIHYMLGQFEIALKFLKEAVELEKERYECLLLLGGILTETGDYEGAFSSLSSALKDDYDNEALAMLGYLFACESKIDKANEVIDRITSTAPKGRQYNVQLARIYLKLGNKKLGYRLLNKALENREGDLIAINIDPRWATVRHDIEFQRIVEGVGLSSHFFSN